MNILNYHLKELEKKEEGEKGRKENNSSCTAMAKASPGKVKEMPQIEKNEEMKENRKITSGGKDLPNRPIKFSLKKKMCAYVCKQTHIYTHTHVYMFHLNSKDESNQRSKLLP